MAQNQLTSPLAENMRTPSRDGFILNVNVSDIDNDNASQGTDNASQGTNNVQSEDGTDKDDNELSTESDSRPSRSWRHATNSTAETGESNSTSLSKSGKQGQRDDRRGKKRKRDESSSESSSESSDSFSESSEDSELEACFNPSNLLAKGLKVSSRITKYIEKYANQGITKKCRLEVTKNCGVPNSKKLAPKKTDRFVKKLCRRKFGTPLSMQKERAIINTQNRILDASGPLSILWSEAEKMKQRGHGLNPDDVINIVQRALVLIGNAHYVYMSDRRRSMLSRILPDCIDLMDDTEGRKALLKANGELFGRKFKKMLTEESNDNKDLFNMLPTRSNMSKRKFPYRPSSSSFSSVDRKDQFFHQGPSNNQRFGGVSQRGRAGSYRRGQGRRGGKN